MQISDSAVKVQISSSWIKYYLGRFLQDADNEFFTVDHDTLGNVTIEVSEPELESLVISPQGIEIVCNINLSIRSQDLLIASSIAGAVQMEVRMQPRIIESTFYSNLVVRRIEWLHKPKVTLGKLSFAPEKTLAKILHNQISRISALLVKVVDEKANSSLIPSEVDRYIGPLQWSFLTATISEISIVLLRIKLGDESVSLGAQVDAVVSLSKSRSKGPVLELQMRESSEWPDDSYIGVSIQLEEVNELCKLHATRLGDLVSEHQIEFDQCHVTSENEELKVEVGVTKPIEIPLLAELKLIYQPLGELLELSHFNIGSSKGAGLLAKSLLFIANNKIDQLVSAQFPMKLSKARRMLEEILLQMSMVRWQGELICVDSVLIGEEISMKIRKQDQWHLEKEEQEAILDAELFPKPFKGDG